MEVVRVAVPGSKSEAIRALILGATARGTTRLSGVPSSDDVRAVIGALRVLGIRVTGSSTVTVHGCGGRWPGGARRLHLRGSATGLRLLAGIAEGRPGRTILDGDASLRRRIGGRPLVVEGPAPPGGVRGVDGSATSQQASGLLLAGRAIRIRGRLVSRPYLDLTIRMIRRFGGSVRRSRRVLTPDLHGLRGRRIRIEPDWSSAAYPLLAGRLLGRRVSVPGLRRDSRQADRLVLRLLRHRRPFRIDLRDAPDLAPVAAALALFLPGESRVTGAAHLRGKESDRIAACVAAARALGGRARATRDGFVVRGGTPRAGVVDSRGDHRIALAFSVAAAAIPGARVRGTACVRKSWPGALRALGPLLRVSARRSASPRSRARSRSRSRRRDRAPR